MFITIFHIYCSPLGTSLGFIEAAQHFGGDGGGQFKFQHTSSSTCSASSGVSLSKAFGCLTGEDVCSDDLGAHPGVNSPQKLSSSVSSAVFA